MNDDLPFYTIDEFERESRHLERNVWEALDVAAGARVLMCGYGPDGAYVQRAIEAGADVTVIEHRDRAIAQFAHLGARLLRGSTSVIPARDRSFDLAISIHYLHEVDPFFHAQIVAELARVAHRVGIVEPAPPADALGKRIALLYSQAKRELGAFEYYQPIEYWKKLLQSVKADIAQHVFAFAKVPPHEYLDDTVELLLRTIEVEQAPQPYIDELRLIAARSESVLLPPPRFVLIGAPVGELTAPRFSAREPKPEPAPEPVRAAAPPASAPTPAAPGAVSAETGYEFPPVDAPASSPAPAAGKAVATPAAPAQTAPAPAAVPPSAPAPRPAEAAAPPGFGFGNNLPFGVPQPPNPSAAPPPPPTPFGAPFAMPAPENPGAPPPTTAWQWEPPEGDEDVPFGQPPFAP